MDWDIVIVAVAGVAGAVLAPLAAQWLQARNDRAGRRHEAMMSAYLDAMAWVRQREAVLERMNLMYDRADPPLEVAHPDSIGARLRLLASPAVREAWARVVASSDRFTHEISEFHSLDVLGQRYLPPDNAVVIECRAAIDTFYAAVTKDVGSRL